MEALHGGSSRVVFILPLYFKISLEAKIRQDILKNKHGAQHMFFSWAVQVFFFLHFEVQFFLPCLLRWCYIILDNFHSCFAIHMLSRMRYFKSINLFIGVILCHITPKAFPKECCYYSVYQWSKFPPILAEKEVFPSLRSSQLINLLVVAGCHLIILRCLHKPTRIISFRCWFSYYSVQSFLARMLPKFICGRSCHFLRPFIPTI